VEVILLADVEKLGLRGDVVDVKRGYARNFLLPRRLAEPATEGKLADLRRRDELRARQEARTFDQGQQVAEALRATELRFDVKAGPTGALFGSVTPTDIADEIWTTQKIRVDRRKIDLDTIKRIGRYEIPIDLFQDVRVEVKALVVPEGGELPPEEELAAMAAAEEAEARAAAGLPAEAADEPAAVEAPADEVGVAEPDAAATAPEEAAEAPAPDVPDDAFDRAVDSALEREGEQL
jgi:large subunit ribosomal protein L9